MDVADVVIDSGCQTIDAGEMNLTNDAVAFGELRAGVHRWDVDQEQCDCKPHSDEGFL